MQLKVINKAALVWYTIQILFSNYGCSIESLPASILDFLCCINSTHKFQAQLHPLILHSVSGG